MKLKDEPEKFKPTFENGGFWEYYRDLERQFQEFQSYIPYVAPNEQVCSFRLLNLLLNIGGHIDSVFKQMAVYEEFEKDEGCKKIRAKVEQARDNVRKSNFASGPGIKLCLKTFEALYLISKQTVTFKRVPERDILSPFEVANPKTGAPYWWDVYNNAKHDTHEYFNMANLKAVRDALAGAFLLNAIHIPSVLRLNDYHLLTPTYGEMIGLHSLENSLVRKERIYAVLETPLFIFDYENRWLSHE